VTIAGAELTRETVYCANVAAVYPGMTRTDILSMPLVHGYQAESLFWRRSFRMSVRPRWRAGRKSLGALSRVIAA